MSKEIDVNPGQLGCINLRGIDPKKLEEARRRYAVISEDQPLGLRIHIRINPLKDTEYIILDGHHRALVSYENDRQITATLWEDGDKVEDPLLRLNFNRSAELHQTAVLCGLGTIEDLENQVRRLVL